MLSFALKYRLETYDTIQIDNKFTILDITIQRNRTNNNREYKKKKKQKTKKETIVENRRDKEWKSHVVKVDSCLLASLLFVEFACSVLLSLDRSVASTAPVSSSLSRST